MSLCYCSVFRYSIERLGDAARAFRIDPHNGTITVAKALDRETAGWHNLTVEATEMCKAGVVFTRSQPMKCVQITPPDKSLGKLRHALICRSTEESVPVCLEMLKRRQKNFDNKHL